MALEFQILAAFVLDALFGDPRRFPHPVRLIGAFAESLETPLRRLISSPRIAGIFAVAIVVAVTGVVVYGIVTVAAAVHPVIGGIVSVLLMYMGIATRDMMGHSRDVYDALAEDDIVEARRRVGFICGRDTQSLDREGCVKAAVESVAENTVDGVTAPIFFAVLAGPVGLYVYKAVSTLDSTFGYKNERYREFGWASARLDDVFAYIPSRLTGILVPVAAWLLRENVRGAWASFLRDRNKHPSPNAGQAEAGFAGALGVQLGGESFYGGIRSVKPTLGDALKLPVPDTILKANRLMLVVSLVTSAALFFVRIILLNVVFR